MKEAMKLFSEASRRNKGPIGDVLQELLTEPGLVLEVGSGTGQHAVAFSHRFPHLTWQPTNAGGPDTLKSVAAYREEADLPNLRAPQSFDLFDDLSTVEAEDRFGADQIVAINVIHIAPADAIDHLFRHADHLLPASGILFLYGPFRHPDRPLEPSNEQFHRFLQNRDPRSGIRDLTLVDEIASRSGFTRAGIQRLPANNDALWYQRDTRSQAH